MRREYYFDTITDFLKSTPNEIIGKLVQNNDFALEQTQRDAWLAEINILASRVADDASAGIALRR
jgi:hypothetical protein